MNFIIKIHRFLPVYYKRSRYDHSKFRTYRKEWILRLENKKEPHCSEIPTFEKKKSPRRIARDLIERLRGEVAGRRISSHERQEETWAVKRLLLVPQELPLFSSGTYKFFYWLLRTFLPARWRIADAGAALRSIRT